MFATMFLCGLHPSESDGVREKTRQTIIHFPPTTGVGGFAFTIDPSFCLLGATFTSPARTTPTGERRTIRQSMNNQRSRCPVHLPLRHRFRAAPTHARPSRHVPLNLVRVRVPLFLPSSPPPPPRHPSSPSIVIHCMLHSPIPLDSDPTSAFPFHVSRLHLLCS